MSHRFKIESSKRFSQITFQIKKYTSCGPEYYSIYNSKENSNRNVKISFSDFHKNKNNVEQYLSVIFHTFVFFGFLELSQLPTTFQKKFNVNFFLSTCIHGVEHEQSCTLMLHNVGNEKAEIYSCCPVKNALKSDINLAIPSFLMHYSVFKWQMLQFFPLTFTREWTRTYVCENN